MNKTTKAWINILKDDYHSKFSCLIRYRNKHKKICNTEILLTFSTEFEYSIITLTRTLVSAKNLSMKGSSAQITRTANPGPKLKNKIFE